MSKKERTYALAKVELFEPTEEVAARAQAAVATLDKKAFAATQQEMISHILENPQDDLQYYKAVYATCGFNLNDDVFVNEEFWNARKSPVLKPANWQHKDKDILGVIYAVEAQYLDGTPIDMENEKIPEDDFELIVHGVVYKYTFPDYAEEIEKRSEAGELFVSMETWFADYAYALLDEANAEMQVVERTERTVALDKYLRCKGGEGQYNGKRVGRVLKGLTFGGMGFVDQPANPRSGGLVHASEDIEIPQTNNLEKNMHDKNEVREAVAAELDERAKAAEYESLKAKVDSLKEDNATASENAQRAAEKAQRAEEALAVSEAVLAKIGEELDEAIAGLGDNPPAEIARIDEAEDKFAAKIAFLGETAKASTDEALKAEIEELKAKVEAFEAAEAEAAKAARTEARTAEVQELLGEDADEEASDKLLAGLIDLEDEEYEARIEALRIVAGKGRPTLEKDGGRGSVEEEGKSGESKVRSPREDRKINVSASLENAEVEETVEPTGGDEPNNSPFHGLASKVGLENENKE